MKTQKISFTSRLKIRTPDGITKISGENVAVEILPGIISNGHRYLSITSLKKDAIQTKATHPHNKMTEYQDSAHFGMYLSSTQLNKFKPILDFIKNPFHKNYTVSLEEANDKVHVSEYKNILSVSSVA